MSDVSETSYVSWQSARNSKTLLQFSLGITITQAIYFCRQPLASAARKIFLLFSKNQLTALCACVMLGAALRENSDGLRV